MPQDKDGLLLCQPMKIGLTYRSGIINADADGLSQKAIEVTKFPEVLKAISTSVNASGQSAPCVQTFAISAVSDDIVEQDVPQELLETTALKTTDWKPPQLADRNISQILEYLALGHRPLNQMVEESKRDKRFFRDLDISSLQCYSVLSDILVKNELCIPLERGSNVLSTAEGFICLSPPSKRKIAVLFCSNTKRQFRSVL